MAARYDRLTDWYSRGRVRMSKLAQLDHLSAGQRVLYAGVGTGEDAIEAIRLGAVVTGIDLSRKMITLVEGRCRQAGLEIELHQLSLFDHRPAEPYDVVCANYLLDCFPAEQALVAMRHLVGLVRPGGLFLIADVTPPTGSPLARTLARVHHFGAFSFTRLQGLTPLFPLYDYPEMLGRLGVEVESRRFFPLWEGGPILFQSLAGRVSSD
jgi:2-polyprenyl-3-methyl-5-hydroxy-6-metoxy-1,4-benzoquinol methylase